LGIGSGWIDASIHQSIDRMPLCDRSTNRTIDWSAC
jgi:hypothetical protein